MVNYKRALCEGLVVVALAGMVAAAPAPADCSEKQAHFDMRQNGSENYRLNIDGVVIAVAPADSLLAAASDIDFGELLDLSDLDFPSKPPSNKPPSEVKPQESKPPAESSQAVGTISSAESKPDASKPEAPLSDVSLPNDIKDQKKEQKSRKHEKAQRLKMRLANMLLPLLRRNLHHNNSNNNSN